MDGHLKAMKPNSTINSVDTGQPSTTGTPPNMWTIDNSNFTDNDHTLDISATPFTFARENLRYAGTIYQ